MDTVDPIGEKEGDEMANDQDNRMGRRDFFVTAGKLVIPTLGILGLSLVIGDKAQAAGCKNCASNCTRSCIGSCTATCEGWAKGMVK